MHYAAQLPGPVRRRPHRFQFRIVPSSQFPVPHRSQFRIVPVPRRSQFPSRQRCYICPPQVTLWVPGPCMCGTQRCGATVAGLPRTQRSGGRRATACFQGRRSARRRRWSRGLTKAFGIFRRRNGPLVRGARTLATTV